VRKREPPPHRRRAGRWPRIVVVVRARVKGNVARPLDGSALRLGRARSPAKGPAAEPRAFSSGRHGRLLPLCSHLAAAKRVAGEREEQRKKKGSRPGRTPAATSSRHHRRPSPPRARREERGRGEGKCFRVQGMAGRLGGFVQPKRADGRPIRVDGRDLLGLVSAQAGERGSWLSRPRPRLRPGRGGCCSPQLGCFAAHAQGCASWAALAGPHAECDTRKEELGHELAYLLARPK
jgi:hypothetical protein